MLDGKEEFGLVVGELQAKGDVNNVAAHVKSGDLSAPSIPVTKIDVKRATSATFLLGCMISDEVSFEFHAGLTCSHFYGVSPARRSPSSAFGLSRQLRAMLALGERWVLDASVIKTFIENTNTLSTGCLF